MLQIQKFCNFAFEYLQVFKICRFLEHSLVVQLVFCTHDMLTYYMYSDIKSRILCLVIHPLLFWFNISKQPQRCITIHYCGHTEWIKSLNKVVSLITTFQTTLVVAADKVETCHHSLQVYNVVGHVYPALMNASQTFANKILRTKFCGWLVDYKNLEIVSLKTCMYTVLIFLMNRYESGKTSLKS